jgi:non-canonical poly(A) RNA polymerase PAPD5/7
MGDSYRPMRHDREQPPPRKLADRITFGDGGDNYRPGGQNRSDFTFESKHPAPHFPPSGPANGSSRGPPRSNRNGGGRGGRRGDHHGRGNANGSRRGRPYQKPAPHQRALLQHHDDGQEQTYGVSDGPNRFMNIDDMSDHEEADMDESDASGNGEVAEGQDGNHKVARTLAPRDDGNAVPKWSNPDPYTSLPPPSETTGVKKDVVKLIRKAKNQAAEKAIGNNAVAANDDFISFGDDAGDDGSEDGEVDDEPGLQIYEDDEPVRGRAKDNVSHRPVQGSMNDLTYVGNVIDDSRRNGYDSYTPTQPSSGNKRKAGRDVPIVHEWILTSRSGNPTPWAASTQTYKHLAKDPKKW